jgi:putative SOS response-associated peptidase YedK
MDALVLRHHAPSGERRLGLLRWGLLPHFADAADRAAPRPINARAETVRTSGLFRGAFQSRRALVPADAFYEWRKDGKVRTPFAVARADGTPMAFAALWESNTAADGTILRSFTIITTTANQLLRPIHERMPVVVEPENWPLWLGEVEGDPMKVLQPSVETVLRSWRVGVRVGRVSEDDPGLLDPVPDAAASGVPAMLQPEVHTQTKEKS